MIEVCNLETGQVIVYSCEPREAVISAYAQERNDWNTWDYEKRYSHLVRDTNKAVCCGNWIAITGSKKEYPLRGHLIE